jgi:hypothetical protein
MLAYADGYIRGFGNDLRDRGTAFSINAESGEASGGYDHKTW